MGSIYFKRKEERDMTKIVILGKKEDRTARIVIDVLPSTRKRFRILLAKNGDTATSVLNKAINNYFKHGLKGV